MGDHRGIVVNYLSLGSGPYEKVEDFKYVGSVLTNHSPLSKI